MADRHSTIDHKARDHHLPNLPAIVAYRQADPIPLVTNSEKYQQLGVWNPDLAAKP